jgi:hypothetical protein
VNGSRVQFAQRSCNWNPAIFPISSSSDGHTNR